MTDEKLIELSVWKAKALDDELHLMKEICRAYQNYIFQLEHRISVLESILFKEQNNVSS